MTKFDVQTGELLGAASGISEAVSPMEGFDLSGACADGAAFGEGEVHGALTGLCRDMQNAARSMTADAATAGTMLQLTARKYAAADDAAEGWIQRAPSSEGGN
ncbi:hypothetical protein EV191_1011023 [Tamaricihabitans halophyticus]|uniref:Excreted virulence factor EspC (Type VII ESX diderm) n=1 Tax=Tamaricihabitans halophyticus TaxID=1262583 RepID=A0A4R2RBH5_9PSEU|nr:hypothetical protein [Tamaricihabitans halophyticus]TCP57071.1 hypothetical protein EV191_1011023 [Tamaricihabitans halophyticus]